MFNYSQYINFVYPLLSILAFSLFSFLISENRKKISFSNVVLCFFWQIVLAILLFKLSNATVAFEYINSGLQSVSRSTEKAMSFCFGGLSSPPKESGLGFILALQGFPILIVISALSSLLIYWRILPIIIKGFSIFFRKTMHIGGTLGIAVAANMFTGMSETPLVIRPYLNKLTRNELFCLMSCGTAGTAGSVMVLYSIILGDVVNNAISHVITAAILNIPAALAIARIMVPDLGKKYTEGDDANFTVAKSSLDAIYTGIIDGGKVIITIIAMLIGFIALLDILNQILSCLPFIGDEPISMQRILGWIMSPVAMLIGIPMEEAQISGSLIGTKIIMNELVGFQHFVQNIALMSPKTQLIVMYALLGFANIGSIGVMIGVYGVLVPDRRNDVINLGARAVLSGTFANCITASIAGAFF